MKKQKSGKRLDIHDAMRYNAIMTQCVMKIDKEL
jgi:hypothetical protein